MPEFHCHCECSKCPPPAPNFITSLQSLNLTCLSQPADRSLWQVASVNLKCFLEFGYCFRLCFKLVVSIQHCTPQSVVHLVYIRRIWRPLVLWDEIWTVDPQPVPCIARCVCWRAVLLKDEPGEQLAIALKER